MFKPFAIVLAVSIVLAGCATHTSAPVTYAASENAIAAVHLPEDFDTPVLQDAEPPFIYTPAKGSALEQRAGYAIDHSVAAQAKNNRIRHLVLHYTGGDDAAAFKALTGRTVSAHYLVLDRPGEYQGRPVVLQMVDENKRAWHAGTSHWKDRSNLNDTSIGIEIVNHGFNTGPEGRVWDPFSEAQIALVIALSKDIVRRYGITPTNVVGHADITPGRKLDPGPFFPWQRLADAGIGAWPERATVAKYLARFQTRPPTLMQLQQGLANYGYGLTPSGMMDDETRKVLKSFQMHFRPTEYSGTVDDETAAILFALLEKYQGSGQVRDILNP
ncbi:N-acetylmuramoyl-L-alanine amidase [Phytohalomonas tamaricis]|uniref:N-acetylmuramoyl-L-alanine amidase n=1 Tax=Phytohalomonas tamaricis TaxID=2081032 RepID=UPI000D0ABACB|nr:N-acetylmuramoyl-L-alanine amidase [Phytohalomonas tamaricis]